MIKAHVLFVNAPIYHVDDEVLAEIYHHENDCRQIDVLLEYRSHCEENENRETVEPRKEAIFISISHQYQAYYKLDKSSSHDFNPVFHASFGVVFVDNVGVHSQKAFPEKPV